MTLADLLPLVPTMTANDAKALALVFDQTGCDALQQAQPDGQHRAAPVQLTDGRWMLCADLLTEIHPGGLYAAAFARLPQDAFDQVEVMPWADAVALVPVPEVEW
jgi:hypothetical protein